jgi:hypothetical protein
MAARSVVTVGNETEGRKVLSSVIMLFIGANLRKNAEVVGGVSVKLILVCTLKAPYIDQNAP